MGLYIDPTNGQTKEQWLQDKGTNIPPAFIDPATGEVTVCLVNNGPFTAAAVAYSESEFNAFNQGRDMRPKMWFRVSVDDVMLVTGGRAASYFRG